jgi:hypothetical protein
MGETGRRIDVLVRVSKAGGESSPDQDTDQKLIIAGWKVVRVWGNTPE